MIPDGLKGRAFSLLRKPQGRLGVWLGGHREYAGGLWDEIGKLQFDFMIRMGLKPERVLLDIACGALRGGRYFIPYLNRGHYLGIDKERSLIRAGISKELGRTPDFALAQSLLVISRQVTSRRV